MAITDLVNTVLADIVQLQADATALQQALQGLDTTTIANTLNALVASFQQSQAGLQAAPPKS